MKKLMISAILAPAVAMTLIGAAVGAADTTTKDSPPPKGRAVINFANLPHRIDSWEADGTKGVYLRVGYKKWYHATFMGPCNDLPFKESIGIVTDGMDRVDHFSSIVVSGPVGLQRCWFKTVDEVAGPPKKSKSKADKKTD